ncbi:TPP-dependent indolepyruvate ferredoxin oxidoreductase alpha subunit [Bradyrhizobium elkanii]
MRAASPKSWPKRWLQAAAQFARANPIDTIVLDSKPAQLGIITTGKAYLDVRQALADLGVTSAKLSADEVCWPFYELAAAGPAPIAGEMPRRIAELYRIEDAPAELEPGCARSSISTSQKTKLSEAIRYTLSRRVPNLLLWSIP